ncbi:hypothetical protein ACFL2D_02075 [Patescibacteria group bacterium]
MIAAYFLIFLSIIFGIVGIIVGIILLMKFKGKKKLYTCLFGCCIFPLAILLGGVGSWMFTQVINDDQEVGVKDYYEELHEDNEVLKERLGLTGETEVVETPTTEEPATTITEDDFTDDAAGDPYTYNASLGRLFNEDYSFTVLVGKEHVDKIRQTKIDFDDAEAVYMYCYDTAIASEASTYCDAGEAPVFSISVYTQQQWDQISDGPVSELVMAQKIGRYITFSHPNGELPSDVPSTQEFYNSIVASIEFYE